MIVEKIRLTQNASLVSYVLDNYDEVDINRRRPAIVICPGGGYEKTSNREAEGVAIKMLSYGYQAFILRYSVAPIRFPEALIELAKAVSLLREKSSEWSIDKNKIIIAGFSAGGHLAASLGVFWNTDIVKNKIPGHPDTWKPNGLCLAYPVITSGEFQHKGSIDNLLGDTSSDYLELLSLEKQVTTDTPKTFIWHTIEDETVPVENTLLFAQSLQKNKVPFELHIFPNGPHGLSLANEETNSAKANRIQATCAQWPSLFEQWMKENI